MLNNVVSQLVGCAEAKPALESAASHPRGECMGVMVASEELRIIPASFIGVRPNSPPHTTKVESSSPRCLRSRTSAAAA